MNPRRALLIVVAALQLGASASEASFFDQLGRRAYERRNYDQALENFSLVQQVAPSASNLFNMALSAELALRPRVAFAFWEEYLRLGDVDEARQRSARQRREGLAARLATIRVESEPAGAEIYIDRKELGSFGTTPRTMVLDPGTHRLILEHPSSISLAVEVHASLGRQPALHRRLEPRRGVLRVSGVPAHAHVELYDEGDQLVRRGPVGESMLLPIGAYRVRLVAEGYYDVEEEVVVEEGSEEHRRLAGRPKASIAGSILITAGDQRATVRVDGEPRGTTPVVLEGMAPGAYGIELEAPGHRPWTGVARIEAGGVELIRAHLERH